MIKGRLFLLLLIAAALIAYSNSFAGVFIFDDGSAIVENEWIHRLWPPWPILSNVRPFLNFTLALNYAFGGLNVWGYHAVNLLIHLLAGLTLFGIVRRTLAITSLRGGPEGDPSPVIASPKGEAISGLGTGSAISESGIASSRHYVARLAMTDKLAFTISLLWLVHPLQTQSVTYIFQRAESLMGLFYLLTHYFYCLSCIKLFKWLCR